ncbi:porin [Chryseobacterium sp. BIGb0232]|uniref:porin n=1 Tax=Chryseobacterium sp. BIGb0232 TaxID=2940598 RepID=UPI000FBAAB38|nr:porin [Chryseobacterium sp. BIGb0232]MCS4304204.1 putative porin [Chryseobacterium sp. BIGb0232]ROS14089.1 porin-like protein [Chryseobacterium nakagawai]
MDISRQFCWSIGYLLLFIGGGKMQAQEKDSVEILLKPYASLRGHLAVYDNKLELQENASRIGLEVNIKKHDFGIIAGGEIQLNMFKGGTSFNVDGNLSGGFLSVESAQKQQVFGNRLGYLGLDLGKFGTLTIGKQWSVYRDITAYTDKFNVFGSRASATFIGGTDGGETGTGRADQAVIYRNHFGPFYLGGQIQARGGNNGKFIDGFGASLQYEIKEGFFAGAAYNRVLLSDNLVTAGRIIGLTGQPTYFSLGTKYIGQTIDFSIVGVLQKNGDFSQGSYLDPTVGAFPFTTVFNAKGLEAFGKYKFQKFSVLAGYNLYVPQLKSIEDTSVQYSLDPGFKKNDIIVGFSYFPFKFAQIYSEQRFSMGKTSNGEREKSVFTLGLRIDLSGNFSKKISL